MDSHATAILERLDDALYTVDADWRLTYLNRAAETLSGRSRHDLLGQTLWDSFPQAVDLPASAELRSAMTEQRPVTLEYRSPLLGRWLDLRAYPLNDGLAIHCTDITARKAAEERLAYHARVLEHVHDAIVATDAQLRVTAWNRAAAAIYGWTAADALGRDVRTVVGSALTVPRRDAVLRGVADTGSARVETIHHRKDGTPIHVEGAVMALPDAAGRIEGYVTVQRDITDRTQAEAERQRRGDPPNHRRPHPGHDPLSGCRRPPAVGQSRLCRDAGLVAGRVAGPDARCVCRVLSRPAGTPAHAGAHCRGDGRVGRFTTHVRDGRVIATSWAHLRLADGTVIGFGLDLTDRLRAEAERRRAAAADAFRVALADALRPLVDPVEIQAQAARTLGEHVGANRVGYAEDQGDGETAVVTRTYTNGVPGITGRYRYADDGPALLEALRAGRTVVRADIANDETPPAAQQAAQAVLQLGASVTVPLLKAGCLRAVLFVHFQAAHAWSADELALIEETAARTWDAVERARAEAALRQAHAALEQRVQERTAELAHTNALLASTSAQYQQAAEAARQARDDLASLLAVANDIVSMHTMEVVLDRILEHLARTIGYDTASITTLKGTTLTVQAFRTRLAVPDMHGRTFEVGAVPALARLVTTQQPILVDDLQRERAQVRAVDATLGRAVTHRAWLAVPLVVNERVIGILSLLHQTVGSYRPADLERVQAFANQVTIAIHNIELYERDQQAAVLEERTRLARELHDAVTQTLFSASLIAEALPKTWQGAPPRRQEGRGATAPVDADRVGRDARAAAGAATGRADREAAERPAGVAVCGDRRARGDPDPPGGTRRLPSAAAGGQDRALPGDARGAQQRGQACRRQ